MDKRKILAKRVKARMITLDLNNSELAKRAGVSESVVSRAVTATSIPSKKNVKKIAEALGTTDSDLFSDSGRISRSMAEIMQILNDSLPDLNDKDKMFLARFILEPEDERRKNKK